MGSNVYKMYKTEVSKKKNLSSEDEIEDKPQPKFKFRAKKYADYLEAETDDLNLTTEKIIWW